MRLAAEACVFSDILRRVAVVAEASAWSRQSANPDVELGLEGSRFGSPCRPFQQNQQHTSMDGCRWLTSTGCM